MRWCVGEIGVKMVPELGDGKLTWVLRVKVLEDEIGDTEKVACQEWR